MQAWTDLGEGPTGSLLVSRRYILNLQNMRKKYFFHQFEMLLHVQFCQFQVWKFKTGTEQEIV